jgi:hypothetical protein
MEPKECSETSAFNIQTPGKYPEENIPNAQLFHKLSHFSYMFRHYRVILRQLVINTLPSYTSMSNADVGKSFIQQSVLREVQSLFQIELSA